MSCVGIESFVTKGGARCAAVVRQVHIDAVFSKQSLQRQFGTSCNME